MGENLSDIRNKVKARNSDPGSIIANRLGKVFVCVLVIGIGVMVVAAFVNYLSK